MNEPSQPWFQNGLRFRCTQCGNCCTGEPGFVWLSEAEIDNISAHIQEPREVFLAIYTKKAHRGPTLREKSNGDCVFFQSGVGCTIYPVRPSQCRTWPFWESNLRTPESWKKTCEICPGSGQGDLIPAEEITRRLKEIRL